MAKQMSFDSDARAALCRGVDKVARAVRATLGPRGRAVVLGSSMGLPTITVDGATVAREIVLDDPIENLGAELLREVADKTQADAGDGTSTAVVLARALLLGGIRHVGAGANPMTVRRGIDRAVAAVIDALRAQSRPIAGIPEIEQVARVSANLDLEVAQVVAAAMGEVGADGLVSVEHGHGAATELEFAGGIQFDGGYLSPYFVTDSLRLEAVLDEPRVLCWVGALRRLDPLLPLLEEVGGAGRSLLIVAEDVEGDALATLVVNALRGRLRCAAVKAAGSGDGRRELLADVALVTGGRCLDPAAGDRLDGTGMEALGAARRVVVDHATTTVVAGAGDGAAVRSRRLGLEREIEAVASRYHREKLVARRARLGGRVAVIRVGAPTEVALHQRLSQFEDALAATRAALREGIVAGGGVALLRAAAAVESLALSGDEALGRSVVQRAMREPLRWIALNAGATGDVVVEEVRQLAGAMGFNAWTRGYENLVEAGIVDPTLVVRVALQNAASIAGLMLTTDAVVAARPESEEDEEGEAEAS